MATPWCPFMPRAVALVPCAFALVLTGCSSGPRSTNALTEYVVSTPTIDASHPAIVRAATELTSGVRTDPERIRAIVDFVARGPATPPCGSDVASQLLACGPRTSLENAVLLAALARAAGIPSRLHLIRVHLKRFGATADTTESHAHVVAALFFGRRWQLVDASPVSRGWAAVRGDRGESPAIPAWSGLVADLPDPDRPGTRQSQWAADGSPYDVTLAEFMLLATPFTDCDASLRARVAEIEADR